MIQLPDDSEHLVLIGRNGSGKTWANMWHMSLRNYDRMPWIVFDFKGDELIAELEPLGAQTIDLSKVPDEPGIYIVRPLPEIDDRHVENFLRQIWSRGSVGVNVDEGYMIPKSSPAFTSLLTQGRSRSIPMNLNTQRPTLVNRFFFSEASHFQLFKLNDVRDYDTTTFFMPFQNKTQAQKRMKMLPPYHSVYYSVKPDKMTPLSPVPGREHILKNFAERLYKDPEEVPKPAADGNRRLSVRSI